MLSSDNESEEIQNKKTETKNGKKPVKKVSVEEDSSEEDPKLLSKKKAATAQVDKKPAKKQAVEEDSDGSDLAPPKKSQVKPVAKKQPVKKQDDSEDESEEKPVTKQKTQPKKPVKKQANSDEDDSDIEIVAKTTPKKSPHQKSKKVTETFSDNDSDSEAENLKAKKPATKKKQVEDDDDEPVATNGNKKNHEKPQASSSEGHNELFVKNLNYKSTEQSLWDFFGNYGTVTKVKLLTDKATGRSKGIGFVEFSSNEECKAALDDAENLYLDDRQLQVNYSGQKDANAGGYGGNQGGYGGNQGGNRGGYGGGARASSDGKFTAFVKNLPFKTNDNSVRKFFKDCGGINEVRIATDKDTGKLKGFAHVDFDSQEALDKAIAKSGQELDGRQLFIDSSTAKSGGSGGRGGFGGGRGGGRGGYGGGRGSFDPMQKAQKTGAIINTGGKNVTKFDEDSD